MLVILQIRKQHKEQLLTLWHISHKMQLGDDMAKFEVIFYKKENGAYPVKEFINSLEPKMQAKFIGFLELLQDYGNSLREPYSKSLGDGIFELRCKVGNNISRVLYFFYFEGKIVLTNGFVKKTQKTPASEIKLAKRYRDDFIKRAEML